MIRCFVFDIHGVIVAESDEIRKILANEGFDREKLVAIGGAGYVGKPYYEGRTSFGEYRAEVVRLFGDQADYVIDRYFAGTGALFASSNRLREKVITPYSITCDPKVLSGERVSMIQLVAELSRHYALCVFSGNSKERLQLLDQQYDFLRYFQYKVFSYMVGADKPDDAMFQALLKTLPYSADEIIYFDDMVKNIEVGKGYGIHAIQIDELLS